MQHLQDVQEALIQALWREATPEQADRALERLALAIDGMVLDETTDEAAAAWLACLLACK